MEPAPHVPALGPRRPAAGPLRAGREVLGPGEPGIFGDGHAGLRSSGSRSWLGSRAPRCSSRGSSRPLRPGRSPCTVKVAVPAPTLELPPHATSVMVSVVVPFPVVVDPVQFRLRADRLPGDGADVGRHRAAAGGGCADDDRSRVADAHVEAAVAGPVGPRLLVERQHDLVAVLRLVQVPPVLFWLKPVRTKSRLDCTEVNAL